MKTQNTDNIIKILNKLSGFSFFLSIIAAKIQYIPIANIGTAFLNLLSFSFSLIAYSLWFIASRLYPDHYSKHMNWYDFAPFKAQNTYAAFLGMGAAILSLVAIAHSPLAIPASWLFFSSNIIWTIAHYHKLKKPSIDEEYSKSYQKSYLSYAFVTTGMSLVNALAVTAAFFFPLQTIQILVISGLTSTAFSLIIAEYWLDYNYSEHKKTPIAKTSYSSMSQELGPKLTVNDTPTPESYHGSNLLKTIKPSLEIVDSNIIEKNASTCNLLC